ncbi:UDP-N-acetylmuramate dehydrogenase [Iamia majanohamensis]|uniref:UDP-N-acetylenolpyruvoylglucosamine reductase n=1 Tax=Iamia majanohamensis TaxID=467976 RepID=A0AAE9Y6M7_9ACTN|nr:UDP-N-acetylmuramate dehydrogenase [Iamia majanohamensis]WCO65219.1 UDP-N-acetylmuramate dehydrogenase [Iamia majanohamensis]
MADDAVGRAVAVLGPRARRDVPLGPLTTYRLGGPAAVLVDADALADLRAVAAAVAASGLPTLVVGRGSNLLVADEGFAGIAVVMGAGLADVAVEGTVVRAGGAASLPVVARRTAAAGLTGFEWAVGVPGSIGGAVRMNAGGHGSDMAASLRSIRVVDLAAGEDGAVPATLPASGLALGFRSSAVRPTQVVVEAELALAVGDRTAAEAEISEIVRWRRANQPGGANAGSVFVNPPGDSAGRLVDEAGAKGLRIGSAEVSPKHANFIQCDPGGRAADVHALMLEVARRVADRSGTWLRPETRLVGLDWPEGP